MYENQTAVGIQNLDRIIRVSHSSDISIESHSSLVPRDIFPTKKIDLNLWIHSTRALWPLALAIKWHYRRISAVPSYRSPINPPLSPATVIQSIPPPVTVVQLIPTPVTVVQPALQARPRVHHPGGGPAGVHRRDGTRARRCGGQHRHYSLRLLSPCPFPVLCSFTLSNR